MVFQAHHTLPIKIAMNKHGAWNDRMRFSAFFWWNLTVYKLKFESRIG